MWSNILDRISFLSLFLVIVLLPVFFLPFTQIPIETSKALLFVVGLSVSVIFWALARFSDGKITLPKSWLLFSGFGVALVVLLSAFFSSAPNVSFFGTMFDIGSFWFIFTAILFMCACSVVLRDARNANMVLFGTLISGAVVMLFQIMRFFMPTLLSLGVMGAKTDNMFGSWNAFGIFAGFSALLSLIIIEFFSVTKKSKFFFGALIALSMTLVAAVNFTFAWEMLGIFSLIIFVYKVSFFSRKENEGAKPQFPAFSFAIVMISLLFFMSGQFIGGMIPQKLGLANIDPSPNFLATMSVAKQSLAHNPVLGIGPNRFADIWSMYKPAKVNTSDFWDVSFDHGSGLIPSLLATNGYLGILSWLVFFALFITIGIRSVFSNLDKGVNKEMVAFFVLALYLFISSFFYSVGTASFLLAFAFTGVFIGLSAHQKSHGHVTIQFLDDHRKSFFFILFLVVVLVASAAATFKFIERFASVPYYAKTLQAFQTSTENPSPRVAQAEASIAKTLSLYVNDLYLRTYSQVYLSKISLLSQKGNDLTEAEKAQFQTAFQEAVNGAQAATRFNNMNHLNFQSLGNVYGTAAVLGIKDAYEGAVDSYTKAATLNPLNPGIQLALANVALNADKVSEAKELTLKALALKPNFLDAIITLAQIAKNQGDLKTAIAYAEQALALYPQNTDLINYVNALKNNSTPPVIPETVKEEKSNN
jgi:tetratricopeptide (TPR) repeat protein